MENKELLKEVQDKARTWLDSNINQETRDKILDMMENDPGELIESFYQSLEFGTGGLRGIMGAGTNRMNIYTVGMATQGLCNYMKSFFSGLDEIKVAIAHDCRNNSRLPGYLPPTGSVPIFSMTCGQPRNSHLRSGISNARQV